MTLQDVARAAEVHAASVSRALRGRTGEVSEETRRHILRIAKRLGYQPNALAASLRTNRTNLVAIVVTDIGNPVIGPVIKGVESQLRKHNLMGLVVQTTPAEAERRDLVVQLANRRIAGLVLLAAERDDPMLDETAARGLPAVLVYRGFGEKRFSSVVNDEAASVRLVLEHLASLGHRRIAHIHGPLAASPGLGRYTAFRELAPAYGFRRPTLVQAAAFTREAGATAARQLLRRKSAATAIFASSDLLAIGVLEVLRAEGIRVPQDVSLVGHNDMPLVDLLEPPLTTVRVAMEKMGDEGAQMLVNALQHPQQRVRSVVLAPQLVVRASTAAPAEIALPHPA